MLRIIGATALLALGALVYQVRPRRTDSAERRRELWRRLPNVELPAGVTEKHSEFVTSKGVRLFVVEFVPEKPSKGVICVCHGFADQISWLWYPKCVRLAKEGYTVIGLDLEGHGRSDGLHILIEDFRRLVEGAHEVFESFRKTYNNKKKWFLAGESMGGAVALWILLLFGQEKWDGIWLTCPMCKISDDIMPHWLIVATLKKAAELFPTWPLVPSKNVVDLCFRDPKFTEIVKASPLYVDFPPRLKTGSQLIVATQLIDENMEKITLPYLIVQGDKDCVTDPRTVVEFHNRSQSLDKTLHMYPGVLHGIYEDPVYGELVWKDTLRWFSEHMSTWA